ncbi:hypothetical protein FRB99_007586, partial [Tulasnella sp. 403]
MAPHVAVIVTTVVVGVGVAVVVAKFWPRFQPEVETFTSFVRSQFERRREQPYTSLRTDDSNDENKKDDDSSSSKGVKPSRRDEVPKRDPSRWNSDLRQRAPSALHSDNLVDLDVEMVQLDKTKPALQFLPMTPTLTGASSRGPISPIHVDDNPFIEPPPPTAIPLPVSPESSLLGDSKDLRSSQAPAPTRSPIATSLIAPQRGQTPPVAQTPSPAPQKQVAAQQVLGFSRMSHHHASSSQSSNFSSGILSPPPVHAGVRSPVARATSPSAVSDSVSLVSVAPSRTWTDGGTADIFSGSERDFQTNESDDDVRSVSDSGSWEN